MLGGSCTDVQAQHAAEHLHHPSQHRQAVIAISDWQEPDQLGTMQEGH